MSIVGHISRPVVGEGRGLPDRQMFFVNSRPCNLPQVRKAFNEVYKSYNVSQSPFVFADIKLDTNAYDVNVSPDKRTIMLHDQATLLENLRDALAELFEGHDQSVPQAQLLGKRTSSLSNFKPPTMQQRSSKILDLQEPPDPIPIPEPRRLSSTDIDPSGSTGLTNETSHPGFMKASLIERFAERDSEVRGLRPSIRRKRSTSPDRDNVKKRSFDHPNTRPRNGPYEPTDTAEQPQQQEESPLFEPEDDNLLLVMEPDPNLETPEDRNVSIVSHHSRPASPEEIQEQEETIPAIVQTPQRLIQSSIQNAFDRMRPMRTPVQQATITIGDTTTVSTVGSSSESRASKRARIHTPKFSLNGTPLTQTPKKSTFLNSLRGFAAPGTQTGETGEEEEEEQDAVLPTEFGRSPSPRKQLPTREFVSPPKENTGVLLSASRDAIPSVGSSEDVEQPELEALIEAEGSDAEYIDESEKKVREEAKIARLITEAEEAAARPTEENLKRAIKLFKIPLKKYLTTNLERIIKSDTESIATYLETLQNAKKEAGSLETANVLPTNTYLSNEDPEERLSLTVTKSDFNDMRIIGQFNLGFILAVRPQTSTSPSSDLFIIDQHASDEKYNFERFSATTVLVSQRLVHPHPLELTAVEQELIVSNTASLTANGFAIENDADGPDGKNRFRLTSLPMSKEVTFTPHDLSELLALIMDNPPSSSLSTSPHIPRPSKIRKLLASRACRGSVMIGKTLKNSKMEEIVRHMGSMDKPWSCPHGRPTMRHLYGLEKWEGWEEGGGVSGLGEVGTRVNWKGYLKKRREDGWGG